MRKIKDISLHITKRSIINSFNSNRRNLILTNRGWGLTTLLINYVNSIPNNYKVFLAIRNNYNLTNLVSRITHLNCFISPIDEIKLIGKSFDYIICDDFFCDNWFRNLFTIQPNLKQGGKIIIGDTGSKLTEDDIHNVFRNYNKILKRTNFNE